jgi:chaperonin GroES
MNVQPLNDNILIKIKQQAQEEFDGIFMPQTSLGRCFASEVIDVGPDVRQVTVGEKILADKYTGVEMEIDDEQYMFVKESEVLAII